MNCFAGCLQMAGTVMTHRMSSFTIRVEDWSESSWRQWFLKKRRAWANTLRASIPFLLLSASLLSPYLSFLSPFPHTSLLKAAVVAAAMILIQHSEAMNSKVAFYRQHFAKVIADKHEDSLTKFGAVIAQGIIDAGKD